MKTSFCCSRKNRNWKPLKILLIGCFFGSIFFINQAYGQDLPTFECTTTAYLSQGSPTDFFGIDLVTGDDDPLATGVHSQINAIGYNSTDDYIYGWNNANEMIVRVGSDFGVEELTTIPSNWGDYSFLQGLNFQTGAFAEDGTYWIAAGGTTPMSWAQIDLRPGSGTYGQVLQAGQATKPTTQHVIADWGYNVEDGHFYALAHNSSTGNIRVWRFDTTTPGLTQEANLGPIIPTGTGFGAVFADADGFLYGSLNATGKIIRLDMDTFEWENFADGPASGGNDGAMCVNAQIYTDFGDVPDDYGTTLAEDGPRHAIPGYNDTTNTAPLMLGTQISTEPDGQPSAGADADTLDDGVAGPIVLAHDQSNTITVTVTNNTSEPATLVGWIDQNQPDANGVFGNGAERVVHTPSIPANSGTATYNLTFPTPAHFNDTYARFRLFPGAIADADALPTGPAAAGEVEDYPVMVDIPAWECTPDGILFQNGPADVYAIDLITGEYDPTAVDFYFENINGIGYNIEDGFIYGHVQSSETSEQQIVRVGADGSVQELDYPDGVSATGRHIGDVDENGHYWMSDGTNWWQIDLDTFTLIESMPVQGGGIGGYTFADWAYVPDGGDYLYTVVWQSGGSNHQLYRLNRATHNFEHVGALPNLPSGNSFGALYADADGYLYASSNQSGSIYRIDIQAPSSEPFSNGPDSGRNDGAMCSEAAIRTDFGDVPDDYGTTLVEDGPRHGLRDYDPDNNTTSLMLGTNVSHETNGQPSAGADADTLDDGVAGPIVLAHDQPNTITVTVTNNTSEPATLVGWIDQNQPDANGVFGSGNERVVHAPSIPANSGTATYDLTFPTPAHFNDTYARFRLFPGDIDEADALPIGPVSAGEVEDYPVTVELETWECSADAYLFQYPGGAPTSVFSIDMATGDENDILQIDGRTINATAYNPLDNYIYGWDNVNNEIVRIGSDGSVQGLTLPNNWPAFMDNESNIAEFDTNGTLWMASGGASTNDLLWVSIDMDPASASFFEVQTSGQVAIPGSQNLGDWAFNSTDGDLYSVTTGTTAGDRILVRFDPDTGNLSVEQNYGPLVAPDGTPTSENWGAAYADADGFIYVQDNTQGQIWRVDPVTQNISFFAYGPSTGLNDGARCVLAPLPIDFGDAPDINYGSTLAEAGPRHSVPGYDTDTNTAPLMLGSTIDIESDGQPSISADGDGADENGLVSGITLDTVNPIEVEMMVTNNTDSAATLAGWIDLDGTQSFDTGDRSNNIITIPANTTGTYTLTFPPATTTADTYSRFRLFPGEVDEQDLSPLGPASAGEVEDYPVPANVVDIELNGGPCWRMLSSPVQGLTYANMLDGLWTQGAPGSDYPAGEPNIFLWPNGQAGNDPSGWQPLGDLNQVIPPGTGFLISVFADDNYDGTPDPFPKTLSVSGPAHTGDITPPMNTNSDGWTLVGNPYTQPVDFDSLGKTALTDVGYVYDRDTQTWVSTTTDGYGDVTEGAFATGQGFFVQNDSTSTNTPSLTFSETDTTTGGEFYGKQRELRDYLRLEVRGESLYNSMWIRFSEEGSMDPASGDALELQPLADQYALLGARKADGTLSDIGHFPLPDDNLEIPVHMEATRPGSYTITATDLDLPAATELYLHDLETEKTIPITETFDYTFTMNQSAKSTPDTEGIVPCSATPRKAAVSGADRFLITTSQDGTAGELPDEVALGQNYPNPFNPATVISYQLPATSDVQLQVFDMLGRRVATLVEGTVEAGVHQVSFNAGHLSSGIYLYRLAVDGQIFTRKLTLIK